jgi:hypothetical protein
LEQPIEQFLVSGSELDEIIFELVGHVVKEEAVIFLPLERLVNGVLNVLVVERHREVGQTLLAGFRLVLLFVCTIRLTRRL